MTSLQPVQFGKLVLREKSIAEEYGRYAVTRQRILNAGMQGGWVTLPKPVETSYGHFPYAEAKSEDLEQVYSRSRYELHYKAAESFRKMARAAAQEGITITLASAFRSRHRQVELFHGEAERRGITLEERAKLCAPPGFSEHATGYTVDLKDNTPGIALTEKFEKTRAFRWMLENGRRYGWVLSFPRDNKQGVMYEPWHWRWEGDETSRKIFEPARRFNAFSDDERVLAKNDGAAHVKSFRAMRKVNAHAIEQLEKAGLDVVIGGESQWLKENPQTTFRDYYEPALTIALVRRDNRELVATHRETIETLTDETAGPYKLLSFMLGYAWQVVNIAQGGLTPGRADDGHTVVVSPAGKPARGKA